MNPVASILRMRKAQWESQEEEEGMTREFNCQFVPDETETQCPHCGRWDLITLFNGSYCTRCQEAENDGKDAAREARRLGEW